MYEIGKIYIWQNLVGIYAALNGAETAVTAGMITCRDQFGNFVQAQPTDTLIFGKPAGAMPGMLRPKNPPSGEQLVRDLFSKPPTEAQIQAFKVDEALEIWSAGQP